MQTLIQSTGSMSAGNIRMSNVNMNKYDATQAWSAGTSSKLSLDHQQTASYQSSVRTGTENVHSDADKITHKGTTWIQGPNGESYELNGTFEQTAAGWTAKGTFIDKDGKSWDGTMTGKAKNMDAFQNNAKNGDEAVLQALSIDSKHFSRTHKTEEDDIHTANVIRENKYSEDTSNNIIKGNKTTNYGETQEYSNAYGSLMAGGHEGVHADMYRDFVAMKKGDISQEQFEAKVMNYAKQVSADMPSSLSKNMSFGQGSNSDSSDRSSESVSIIESFAAKFGFGSANGPSASSGFEGRNTYTQESGVSNTQSYTNQRGGSASQDMMAQHIKNEMMGNMESLYRNGGMTKDGAGIGTQLSNELSSFVGGKANKPF